MTAIICGKTTNKHHHHHHHSAKNLHQIRDHNGIPGSAFDIENQILQHSGLTLGEDLHVFDVPIFFQGKNHLIHTYKAGESNSETLVLIHGYGGSSVFYYPMIKDLAQKYRVFCIDLLGMGLSSRSEFNCATPEEAIEYFVGSIEKWRDALDLQEFQLAGHSFGGYMSTQYAIKYQFRVKKLFLLSPAGVTKFEKELSPEEYLGKLKWLEKKKYLYELKYWNNLITPAEFFRKNPVWGKFVLKRYVNSQFKDIAKEQKVTELIYKFCSELLKDNKGAEKAIFAILKPPVAGAKLPLEEEIAKNLTIPVFCYYGDKDWMDQQGARRLQANTKINFKLKEIKHSGHQLTMQNPKQVSQEILMEGITLTVITTRVSLA